MDYGLTADVLDPQDPDREAILDRLHEIHVENDRPWWRCTPEGTPPYPSRNELDAMADRPGHSIILVREGTRVMGYDFIDNVDGVIWAGFLEHCPYAGQDGYRVDFDDWAIQFQTAVADKAREVTGGVVHHVATFNPRVWYALEVQCGLPLWPQAYVPEGATCPTEPPPLPEGIEARP